MRTVIPIAVRIKRQSRAGASGCWDWQGRLNNAGYGHMSVRYDEGMKTVLAHRMSYEAFVGPIPDGLVIDHLCRNRTCVNPAHLEPVTSRENILRSPIAVAAKNARKTHCPQGHPYDGANLYVLPSTGGRYCRACMSAYGARRRATQKAVS